LTGNDHRLTGFRSLARSPHYFTGRLLDPPATYVRNSYRPISPVRCTSLDEGSAPHVPGVLFILILNLTLFKGLLHETERHRKPVNTNWAAELFSHDADLNSKFASLSDAIAPSFSACC